MTLGHAPIVPVRINDGHTELELLLRKDSSSGLVLKEVFREGTYAAIPGSPEPRAILDIGANQGITAAYFRMTCPEAMIVCVEPDPATFPILQENARRIGRCEAHNLALLDRDGSAPFISSSISVVSTLYALPAKGIHSETVDVAVRHAGVFVAEVASRLGVSGFDLLKIDTEGAELPILRAIGDGLAGFETIHIEYHSAADRQAIASLLASTHEMKRERIDDPERGTVSYLRRQG